MTRAFDLATTALLSPVLAAQAVWVTARATRLPEAAGDRNGSIGEGQDLRLLIIGDSSAAGVGVAHQRDALAGQLGHALSDQGRVSWTLIARSGATTGDALRWLADHAGGPYDAAVVAFGVNDVKNGVPLARWQRNVAALLTSLRERTGVQLICFTALPPIGRFPLLPNPLRRTLGQRAARFDHSLKRIVDQTKGSVVVRPEFSLGPEMIAVDGFHPGAQAYTEWANAAANLIRAHRQSTDAAPT